ncbi:MAG: ferrous iron transport protein A [Phycisphaerales bacterium]|nr:ferrous iron transport protein A [Phycisphaerales bacterium]
MGTHKRQHHEPRILMRERAFIPVPLSQLRPGDRARIHADGMKCDACDLLNAMGLTDRCEIRVCKVGEPCIVQVNTTRLGLSSKIAKQIMVVPSPDDPSRRSA